MMKNKVKITILVFALLLTTGAFFSGGVVKSDIPPRLYNMEYVVNPDFSIGVCCSDGGGICICDNCPGQCD